ncbi:uncharacterized protein [Watersipora subatra]|uniref:uncharacterized protein n=1 Tax=Watersipora subatra TaxID=2589382 RepID=UPI00355C48EA
MACIDAGEEGCVQVSYEKNDRTCKLSTSGAVQIEDLSSSVYVIDVDNIPYYHLVQGFGFEETNDHLDVTNLTRNAEDCYSYCILRYGTNCLLFTYGEGYCSIPQQNVQNVLVSKFNISSSNLLSTYFISAAQVSRQLTSLADYCNLTDQRVRDGRIGQHNMMAIPEVPDLNSCYKVCVALTGDCPTFSYNSNAEECFLTTANFLDDWTYLDVILGYNTYFKKDTEKWKLITKHLQRNNENFPDEAFREIGSYTEMVSEDDTYLNGSYTANSYLKNQLIDYWSDLDSKYKVRLELRSTSGSLLQYMEYNAVGTTSTDWFSASNFLESSYSDLSSTVEHNIWEIG